MPFNQMPNEDGGRTLMGNTPTCEDCGQPSDHCTCDEDEACELGHLRQSCGAVFQLPDTGNSSAIAAPIVPFVPFVPFVAFHGTVKQGSQIVGRMVSKTLAKRTANALNRYQPNKEGV